VTSLSVVWEKGNKVSYTEPVHVEPSDSSAEFAEIMTQVSSHSSHNTCLIGRVNAMYSFTAATYARVQTWWC